MAVVMGAKQAEAMLAQHQTLRRCASTVFKS